jgi:hypothetical protein
LFTIFSLFLKYLTQNIKIITEIFFHISNIFGAICCDHNIDYVHTYICVLLNMAFLPFTYLEPILSLPNSHLQRQRCCKLERFWSGEICFLKRVTLFAAL